MVKAPLAKEAFNESEGHPSTARSKAAACSESGRRYRNPPGHSYWLDRERVVEKVPVKPIEKEMEVEAQPPAFQPTSTGAAVSSSCGSNGESDVEALLAKLRALWGSFSHYLWNCIHIQHKYIQYNCTHILQHALNVNLKDFPSTIFINKNNNVWLRQSCKNVFSMERSIRKKAIFLEPLKNIFLLVFFGTDIQILQAGGAQIAGPTLAHRTSSDTVTIQWKHFKHLLVCA